jgi:hypothetical protein
MGTQDDTIVEKRPQVGRIRSLRPCGDRPGGRTGILRLHPKQGSGHLVSRSGEWPDQTLAAQTPACDVNVSDHVLGRKTVTN